MEESFAPCGCRLLTNAQGPHIDSASCKLGPILRAFKAIEEMAVQIAEQEPKESPKKGSTKRVSKARAGESWGERWTPVREAMANLDRVLKEQHIPRGELSCASCNKPIVSGTLLTFHGNCYLDRFEAKMDLRNLKTEARRSFGLTSPARRILMALPDEISKAEAPGVFSVVLELLRTPD